MTRSDSLQAPAKEVRLLVLKPAQALILAGFVEPHDAIPGVHPDDLDAMKTGRIALVDWATFGCVCDYIPGVFDAVRGCE